MTDDPIDQVLAEAYFREFKPDARETEECLRVKESEGWRRSELRGWMLCRTSSSPIEAFSSYYWTPPAYSSSPLMSVRLRARLSELGHEWQLHGSTKRVPVFGCVIDSHLAPFHIVATATSEPMAVALAALKLFETKMQ